MRPVIEHLVRLDRMTPEDAQGGVERWDSPHLTGLYPHGRRTMQTRTSAIVMVSVVLLGVTPASAQTLPLFRAGHDRHAISRANAPMPLNATAFKNMGLGRILRRPSNGNYIPTPAPARHLAASRLRLLAELTTPRSLDINRALDQALTMKLSTETSPMFGRPAQTGQPTAQGGSPVLKWVGVGLMGLGGLVTWDGADCASVLGYGNSLCTRRLAFGGGLAAGGLYLFLANK